MPAREKALSRSWNPVRLFGNVVPIESSIADGLGSSMLNRRKVELKTDLEKPCRRNMIDRDAEHEFLAWANLFSASDVGCGRVARRHRPVVEEA